MQKAKKDRILAGVNFEKRIIIAEYKIIIIYK